MKFLDKKALVTGAGRGIGKACALALAQEGADLLINDIDQNLARHAYEETSKTTKGRKICVCSGDVSSRAFCKNMVETAIKGMSRIDILIHVPALNDRAPFLEYNPKTFSRVMKITLNSGFYVGQLVAQHMERRKAKGKILFISSVHSHLPFAGSVAYNAAKAGLDNMARTMAAELAVHRINVNVIQPGWIDTPGERKFMTEEEIQASAKKLPWGRMGKPAEIAQAALFLCSDEAEYITGSTLMVDGGFSLRHVM